MESVERRLKCRPGLLEKKSGDWMPSRMALAEDAVSGPLASAGISNRREGDTPVRAFFDELELIVEEYAG